MEQVRCYGCSNLLILASLEERRAFKRDCCGISFHHNCVRQEFLMSKCVSCNTYTDGLLLKTVPFPDLVVIEEERSELAPSKILYVICIESESARNKLLVTRCCHQFAHIYFLFARRYYSIADLCSTKDYADEVTARLYSENCFVCCGSPEQEAPLVDKRFQVSPHFTYFPNTLMRQFHNFFFNTWINWLSYPSSLKIRKVYTSIGSLKFLFLFSCTTFSQKYIVSFICNALILL